MTTSSKPSFRGGLAALLLCFLSIPAASQGADQCHPELFALPVLGASGGPSSMVMVDLDGDGRDDLATANSGAVTVLLGQGNLTFVAAAPVRRSALEPAQRFWRSVMRTRTATWIS